MDLDRLIDGFDLVRGDRRGAGSAAPVRITDVTEDSRTIMPGSLFIARPGLESDGRRYIRQAVDAGAAAVLTDEIGCRQHAGVGVPVLCSGDVPLASARIAERFFGDPSRRLKVIGITGTNGKSTVAHLTHTLLNACGQRAGLIGTIEIDDGRERARSEMTTLPAVELSRTLATMVEHGCACAVMEVSSHALDQRRAAALAFDVGVFTMLGSDHLDYHGSIEAYASAKARLFELLPASGLAVVNADDPACERMVRDCRAPVLACGRSDRDASVDIVEHTLEGMRLVLRGPFGSIEGHVPLFGEHNAMNVLQAVCAAHAVGLDHASIIEALPRLTPPRGRLEPVVVGSDGVEQDIAVFVDFAHTADALRSTLGSLRRVAGDRPLVVVFGCGGDRDPSKRAAMGAVAVELADRVVLTSDNPRREQPGAIISMILEGVPPSEQGRVEVHADRAVAIRAALTGAPGGSVVVIAGKGHEREQIVPDGRGGTVRHEFDDAAHARDGLAERLASKAVRA